MIVSYISDLHLEFEPDFVLTNPYGASVLVLAGDVLLVEDIKRFPLGIDRPDVKSQRYVRSKRYNQFFELASALYDHIVYVPGNHEFYGGEYHNVLTVLKNELAKFPKVHLLNDEIFQPVPGVVFIGSTLWTDVNKGDFATMDEIRHGMNDYKQIRVNHQGNQYSRYVKLSPVMTMRANAVSQKFIFDKAKKHKQNGDVVVVVTHHSPTLQSVAPAFKHDRLMNGAYASDLSHAVTDSGIDYWIHGHIHHIGQYKEGATEILCNPHGYPDELNGQDVDVRMIEF